MNISKTGLELIKHFESLKLETYLCPAGKLTIGYGSTGSHVKKGMIITPDQASRLLEKDVQRFEKSVNELVKVELNQNQFDALVDFCFNLGAGALGDSTLLKLLNNGDYRNAGFEFEKWCKMRVKGVLVPSKGLLRRRLTERALYEGETLQDALIRGRLVL